ncbi:hypothetical protein MXB_1988 [Myxobolus squamalis]|nr:hypothetical protein MXB_1988 [Myxobolus squamalis]
MAEIISFIQSNFPRHIIKTADLVYKATFYRSISDESMNFARIYPLASYFVFMMAITIPDVFLSVALGVPFAKMAPTLGRFLTTSLIWYLNFLSPQDTFHRLISMKIFQIVIGILCEVNRKTVFLSVLNRVTRMVPKSNFTVLLIPAFYCSAFLLAIYPLDQLMRGSTIKKHEAKAPHFGSAVVLMYTSVTLLFLTAQNWDFPYMSNLKLVSVEQVLTSVMIVAIFLSIFRSTTGWDPLTHSLYLPTCIICPKVEAKISHVEDSIEKTLVQQDEDEEVTVVETPKRVRYTRKRLSSKL